ncbi:MAG: hypothetical protein Tsb0016_17370 [Sphingomonadales bacterium]
MKRRWLILALLLAHLGVTAPAAAKSTADDYSPLLASASAPGLLQSWQQFRAHPFFARAYDLARAGDSLAAIDWLEQGLARDGAADQARFNLILLALGANQPARALAHADQLLARKPMFAAGYLLRGLVLLALDQRPQAQQNLQAAVERPGLSPSHQRLAQANLAMLRPPPALAPSPPPPRLAATARLQPIALPVSTAARKLPLAWPLPDARLRPRPIALAGHVLATRPAPQALIHALNSRAYQALAAGDLAKAAALFETSLAQQPGQAMILQQLGYLYRAQRRPTAAADAFKQALLLGGLEPNAQAALRRELASLSPDRFDLSGYWVHRGQALSSPELNVLGASLAQSQGGIAAAWKVQRDGHGAALFGRLLWASTPGGLGIDDDTAQAGIGLRLRPLAPLNLVASIERLIAVGDQARDDWMARLSYSDGEGYAPALTEPSWWHWHVYGDLALIDPARPDLLAAFEGRLGRGFQAPGLDGLMLTPFVGANASIVEGFGVTSLVEAGPGLWLRHWFNDGRFAAARSALDLKLEYRFQLAGDSSGGSGLMVTLSVDY